MNCFRYLGFTSLYDIETLTLYEYQMRMKAFRLQQIDKEYDMHLQAWLNYVVQQTKEQGKKQVPVFRKFKDFYDYEKRLNEVEKPRRRLTERQRRLAKLAAITNAKGG